MKKLIVAIDGPAGAGKSTVAKIVAKLLGYIYIDTGAMYRAVTLEAMKRKLNLCNTAEISELARNIQLCFKYDNGKVRLIAGETDVTDAIRTPEVSRMVSEVSQIAGVRTAMVSLQRNLAGCGGTVLDGRDIGTHVLPNADIKIFLTASIDERAKRRWLELKNDGYDMELVELIEEIKCRDRMDCEREISPLVQAPDAVLIDTTGLSWQQAAEYILRLCEEKMRGI